MDYATVRINGNQYYLFKQPDSYWYFTDKPAPIYGKYPVLVTVTAQDGQIIQISTTDSFLIETLSNFVSTGESFYGYKMLNYYPEVIKTLMEYQALINGLGFEFDFLKCHFNFTLNDFYLNTMGEERLKEWEKLLGIAPKTNDPIQNRRSVVMARLQGGFKLNTTSIASIVLTLTGRKCKSYVKDSCLYVKIQPTDQYDVDIPTSAVETELKRRIPAHLCLNVARDYLTWGDVANHFKDWNEVSTHYDNWDQVKNDYV